MASFLIIVVPIVLVIIFIAVSFYLYTMFCHPQDQGLGTSIGSKILIVFGQSLAWAQLMLVVLDLSLGNYQTMQVIYQVVYGFIFVLTVFILPFVSALYQADQDDSKCKQVVRAFVYAFVVAFVWSAFTFFSYIGLSTYKDDKGHDQRISLPLYIMLCQSLVGWILLVINGSIGLFFLPYQLIKSFTSRAQPLTKQQALQLKSSLQSRSDQLIQQGQSLQSSQQQFKQKSSQMNFFSRRKRKGELEKLLDKFKEQVNKLQEDHQKFGQELDIRGQNPIIPYVKLAAGIFCVVVTIVWIAQIIGTTIHVNGHAAFLFLDTVLLNLSKGVASFISAILYGFLVLYMSVCLIKGNIIFGIRIPFIIAFHPLQLNKTYLNSLLFNTLMMLLTSQSILQLSILVFPTYLQTTFIGMFFIQQVSYRIGLFGTIFGDRIYLIVFLSMTGLAMLYLVFRIWRDRRASKKSKSIDKDN